jgi:hypothetical protein
MGLSLHHMLKTYIALMVPAKAARSGILPTCQTTRAVFPLQPANGVPGHQTHVKVCIGSGIPAGIRCTMISPTGPKFIDPTRWSRSCRESSDFNPDVSEAQRFRFVGYLDLTTSKSHRFSFIHICRPDESESRCACRGYRTGWSGQQTA